MFLIDTDVAKESRLNYSKDLVIKKESSYNASVEHGFLLVPPGDTAEHQKGTSSGSSSNYSILVTKVFSICNDIVRSKGVIVRNI
jgi:hypothetical protein